MRPFCCGFFFFFFSFFPCLLCLFLSSLRFFFVGSLVRAATACSCSFHFAKDGFPNDERIVQSESWGSCRFRYRFRCEPKLTNSG
ncbi:hypothetical protein LZ30DRAFT_718465 [Colletotrichum cereale]|nr:hypothetical protein LZ30DRAFT_718465 [Colletotrichum cereale]